MGLPDAPLTLSPAEIVELNHKLSTMRHNINNHLALIVAAVEVIKRKPEMGPKLLENMAQQPDKIINEVRKFSLDFEHTLRLSAGPLAST